MSLQGEIPAGLSVTGSRYFGTERRNSDYDYFAPDSPEIRLRLIELGFFHLHEWERARCPGIVAAYQRDHEHVLLVDDAMLRARVQEAMKRCNLGPLLMYKEMAHTLWTFAYTLLRKERRQDG